MPAGYAHFRFGTEVTPSLPEPVRSLIQRWLPLYQAGFQGPDPFFFYNALLPNKVGRLGSCCHMESGRQFFETALAGGSPSEPVICYLFGVLTHYCLDLHCHPLINSWAKQKIVGHSEVESDFDRHLLELDGKIPACSFDYSAHLRLSRKETDLIRSVYPAISGSQLYRSFHNMSCVLRLLTVPEGFRRQLLRGIMALAGESARGLVMDAVPNPRCQPLLPFLLEQYRQALEAFPSLSDSLYRRIFRGTDLGDAFSPIFG